MPVDPEKQLEEFLASKPDWMRRWLQLGADGLTEIEVSEWARNRDEVNRATEEYEQILQLAPAKMRAYRKRLQDEARAFADKFLVPKGKAGRPRKDDVAREAIELEGRGMNPPQIAAALQKRHGKDVTTPAAVSKLISRFKARTKSSD